MRSDGKVTQIDDRIHEMHQAHEHQRTLLCVLELYESTGMRSYVAGRDVTRQRMRALRDAADVFGLVRDRLWLAAQKAGLNDPGPSQPVSRETTLSRDARPFRPSMRLRWSILLTSARVGFDRPTHQEHSR